MSREYTNKLLELVEEGMLNKDDVIMACVKYMSEDDVEDMMRCNDFIENTDDEYDKDSIDPAGWYIVSSQGVEDGPFDTRKDAKDECSDVAYTPMIGEEVIEMFDSYE